MTTAGTAETAQVPRSGRRGGGWRAEALPAVALFVLLVALWELLVRFELVSEFVLPPPVDVLTSFVGLAGRSLLWNNAWITLVETLLGFVIGSGLAFVVAIGAGLSRLVRRMVYPYMVALQVTPRIAFTPIIIAALGFGITPKVVLAATICFFPVFINTLTGMTAVEASSIEMFRSLRASRWQTFRQLMLPSALPVVFAGLKTAMTLALIGAIVGEFVAAQEGLGLLVQQFSFSLNMDAAFAVLIFLTLLGLVLFLAMEWGDRVLCFWTHDRTLTHRSARLRRRAAAQHDPRQPVPGTSREDITA